MHGAVADGELRGHRVVVWFMVPVHGAQGGQRIFDPHFQHMESGSDIDIVGDNYLLLGIGGQIARPIITTEHRVVNLTRDTDSVEVQGAVVLHLYGDGAWTVNHGNRVVGVNQLADTSIVEQRLMGILREDESRTLGAILVTLVQCLGPVGVVAVTGLGIVVPHGESVARRINHLD